ncbi:MAG TPA: hypothetical protein VII28_01565 [Puia sp.]
MKQLLVIPLLFHLGGTAGIKRVLYPEVDLMQVRMAPWPINMQRIVYYTDTCYAIQFRDQSAMNAVLYKTMDLETLEQLKYFREGLLTLQKGQNGDVAEFRNYTLKKVGTKKANSWYILNYDGAVTNFQEAQANRILFIINTYINSQR